MACCRVVSRPMLGLVKFDISRMSRHNAKNISNQLMKHLFSLRKRAHATKKLMITSQVKYCKTTSRIDRSENDFFYFKITINLLIFIVIKMALLNE